jgi:hypothetical protein
VTITFIVDKAEAVADWSVTAANDIKEFFRECSKHPYNCTIEIGYTVRDKFLEEVGELKEEGKKI